MPGNPIDDFFDAAETAMDDLGITGEVKDPSAAIRALRDAIRLMANPSADKSPQDRRAEINRLLDSIK